MKRSLSSYKADIIEIGRRMYARSYVASNDGNISVRLDKKHVLITASGVSKGFLRPHDLIVVDLNGNVLRGKKKASSEIHIHLEVYKARSDVHGICHAHPPYATGFACAGLALDAYLLPEVIVALGTVPLAAYGTPGTEELHKSLLPLLYRYDAFLLANHGVLAIGTDVYNAYYKLETVEHFAQISFIARQLGKPTVLDDEEVAKLVALRKNFGIRPDVGGLIPTTGDVIHSTHTTDMRK